jgi:hypothetical protein
MQKLTHAMPEPSRGPKISSCLAPATYGLLSLLGYLGN